MEKRHDGLSEERCFAAQLACITYAFGRRLVGFFVLGGEDLKGSL